MCQTLVYFIQRFSKVWTMSVPTLSKRNKKNSILERLIMCDGKFYVSVSVKASVYDRLYKISRDIVPGASITVPKTIEILTNTYKEPPQKKKD